jgi:hypothetical protein
MASRHLKSTLLLATEHADGFACIKGPRNAHPQARLPTVSSRTSRGSAARSRERASGQASAYRPVAPAFAVTICSTPVRMHAHRHVVPPTAVAASRALTRAHPHARDAHRHVAPPTAVAASRALARAHPHARDVHRRDSTRADSQTSLTSPGSGGRPRITPTVGTTVYYNGKLKPVILPPPVLTGWPRCFSSLGSLPDRSIHCLWLPVWGMESLLFSNRMLRELDVFTLLTLDVRYTRAGGPAETSRCSDSTDGACVGLRLFAIT